MGKISNILVIVDPTADTHPAIDKAARIATVFGARVDLFACETKESRSMRYAAHVRRGGGDFIDNIRAILERLAAPLRAAGLDVCIDATSGDPLVEKLVERVKQTCADLIVKDTHHHSLAKRTLLSHTDWQLIRACPVPLLLTKPRPWAQAPQILAAVDPRNVNDKPQVLDHKILEWASALREKLRGTACAVHAYLPVVIAAEAIAGVPPMFSALTPQLLEDERQRCLQALVPLVGRYGFTPADAVAQLGVASDVIPRVATDQGADVVVMGAISRSGVRRIFIGSTAERVLEHLPCDVLVVKPPDFAAALPF